MTRVHTVYLYNNPRYAQEHTRLQDAVIAADAIGNAFVTTREYDEHGFVINAWTAYVTY